jgi:hypothetical protein
VCNFDDRDIRILFLPCLEFTGISSIIWACEVCQGHKEHIKWRCA